VVPRPSNEENIDYGVLACEMAFMIGDATVGYKFTGNCHMHGIMNREAFEGEIDQPNLVVPTCTNAA